jgi:hypothetical protein
VAAADGEDAAGEPVAVPPGGVLAALPEGLDDPPHAASNTIMVEAPAAQPVARSSIPALVMPPSVPLRPFS